MESVATTTITPIQRSKREGYSEGEDGRSRVEEDDEEY
jgi:hypothetical protein